MKVLAENRKALAAFEFKEKFEAGIKLLGPEVKSARLGHVRLTGSYVRVLHDRPKVLGLWISVYPKAFQKHRLDPTRTRDLLLHKKEVSRLSGLESQKGWALVPLKIYLKDNLIKLEIGAGRGLKMHDRREILKRRDLEREVQVALRGKM